MNFPYLPPRRLSAAPLLLVCLAVAGSSSIAAASGASSYLETVVVTADRQGNRLKDLAASISVVDQDLIGSVAPAHIAELTTFIPGVWVVHGNGQEHLTALRSPVYTGAGSCGAYVVAEEGVPTRPVGLCNVNQLFEINANQSGRMEVWRGPGAVTFGSNAIHGVFNFLAAPIAGSNVAAVEAGSDDYYRLSLSVADDVQRFGVEGVSAGGYKDDAGFDQQKFHYRRDHELGGWDVVTLLSGTNLNQETAGFVAGDDAYKYRESLRDNPNPEAYRDAESLRWQSRFRQQLSDTVAVELTPFARYSDMTFIQHFAQGKPVEQNDQVSGGLQSQLQWQLDAQRMLRTGIDIEAGRFAIEEYQPQPLVMGSPFLIATIPQGYHYDYSVDSRVAAGFAQFDWQLSERWQLDVGTRFEQVQYAYDNHLPDGNTRDDGTACGFGGCRFNRPSDRDDSFSHWNSQVGLTYNWSERLTSYARVAQGYRAPQVSELYSLQGEQNVADLEPVEVLSYEAGIRGEQGPLRFDIAAYWMDQDNVIFTNTDRLVVGEGETRHYGIETQLLASLNEFWQLGFNGSWAQHKYREATGLVAADIEGNMIDTAPLFTGNLFVAWSADNLSAQLEAVRVGSHYLDPENEHSYPGHTLFNLRGQMALSKALTINLRLLNLLNTRYADRADYAFGEYRYFVGEPRAVYLGVAYKF